MFKSKLKIVVTGMDGYCGWPVTLKLAHKFGKDVELILCDDMSRRKWVNDIDGESILPISNFYTRLNDLKDKYDSNFKEYAGDLIIPGLVEEIVKLKPDIILHLASQPSAPYAHRGIDEFNMTQNKNMQMLRNFMWFLNKYKMNTHLVVTTTTGIYGAPDFLIPEGNLETRNTTVPYPAMGGSWYHMSRAFDSANMWLAEKQYNFPMTEMRTAIVCGSSTNLTREDNKFHTRFDVDEYFGTVLNRFAYQAMQGKSITVYGSGLQRKPVISLEDMVESMYQITLKDASKRSEQLKIYNQMTETISIVDLANEVAKASESIGSSVEVKHIPNPRIENEEHQMKMENKAFLNLLGESKCSIKETIQQICKDIQPFVGRS